MRQENLKENKDERKKEEKEKEEKEKDKKEKEEKEKEVKEKEVKEKEEKEKEEKEIEEKEKEEKEIEENRETEKKLEKKKRIRLRKLWDSSKEKSENEKEEKQETLTKNQENNDKNYITVKKKKILKNPLDEKNLKKKKMLFSRKICKNKDKDANHSNSEEITFEEAIQVLQIKLIEKEKEQLIAKEENEKQDEKEDEIFQQKLFECKVAQLRWLLKITLNGTRPIEESFENSFEKYIYFNLKSVKEKCNSFIDASNASKKKLCVIRPSDNRVIVSNLVKNGNEEIKKFKKYNLWLKTNKKFFPTKEEQLSKYQEFEIADEIGLSVLWMLLRISEQLSLVERKNSFLYFQNRSHEKINLDISDSKKNKNDLNLNENLQETPSTSKDLFSFKKDYSASFSSKLRNEGLQFDSEESQNEFSNFNDSKSSLKLLSQNSCSVFNKLKKSKKSNLIQKKKELTPFAEKRRRALENQKQKMIKQQKMKCMVILNSLIEAAQIFGTGPRWTDPSKKNLTFSNSVYIKYPSCFDEQTAQKVFWNQKLLKQSRPRRERATEYGIIKDLLKENDDKNDELILDRKTNNKADYFIVADCFSIEPYKTKWNFLHKTLNLSPWKFLNEEMNNKNNGLTSEKENQTKIDEKTKEIKIHKTKSKQYLINSVNEFGSAIECSLSTPKKCNSNMLNRNLGSVNKEINELNNLETEKDEECVICDSKRNAETQDIILVHGDDYALCNNYSSSNDGIKENEMNKNECLMEVVQQSNEEKELRYESSNHVSSSVCIDGKNTQEVNKIVICSEVNEDINKKKKNDIADSCLLQLSALNQKNEIKEGCKIFSAVSLNEESKISAKKDDLLSNSNNNCTENMSEKNCFENGLENTCKAKAVEKMHGVFYERNMSKSKQPTLFELAKKVANKKKQQIILSSSFVSFAQNKINEEKTNQNSFMVEKQTENTREICGEKFLKEKENNLTKEEEEEEEEEDNEKLLNKKILANAKNKRKKIIYDDDEEKKDEEMGLEEQEEEEAEQAEEEKSRLDALQKLKLKIKRRQEKKRQLREIFKDLFDEEAEESDEDVNNLKRKLFFKDEDEEEEEEDDDEESINLEDLFAKEEENEDINEDVIKAHQQFLEEKEDEIFEKLFTHEGRAKKQDILLNEEINQMTMLEKEEKKKQEKEALRKERANRMGYGSDFSEHLSDFESSSNSCNDDSNSSELEEENGSDCIDSGEEEMNKLQLSNTTNNNKNKEKCKRKKKITKLNYFKMHVETNGKYEVSNKGIKNVHEEIELDEANRQAYIQKLFFENEKSKKQTNEKKLQIHAHPTNTYLIKDVQTNSKISEKIFSNGNFLQSKNVSLEKNESLDSNVMKMKNKKSYNQYKSNDKKRVNYSKNKIKNHGHIIDIFKNMNKENSLLNSNENSKFTFFNKRKSILLECSHPKLSFFGISTSLSDENFKAKSDTKNIKKKRRVVDDEEEDDSDNRKEETQNKIKKVRSATQNTHDSSSSLSLPASSFTSRIGSKIEKENLRIKNKDENKKKENNNISLSTHSGRREVLADCIRLDLSVSQTVSSFSCKKQIIRGGFRGFYNSSVALNQSKSQLPSAGEPTGFEGMLHSGKNSKKNS